jgi:hypothetical protein
MVYGLTRLTPYSIAAIPIMDAPIQIHTSIANGSNMLNVLNLPDTGFFVKMAVPSCIYDFVKSTMVSRSAVIVNGPTAKSAPYKQHKIDVHCQN